MLFNVTKYTELGIEYLKKNVYEILLVGAMAKFAVLDV